MKNSARLAFDDMISPDADLPRTIASSPARQEWVRGSVRVRRRPTGESDGHPGRPPPESDAAAHRAVEIGEQRQPARERRERAAARPVPEVRVLDEPHIRVVAPELF